MSPFKRPSPDDDYDLTSHSQYQQLPGDKRIRYDGYTNDYEDDWTSYSWTEQGETPGTSSSQTGASSLWSLDMHRALVEGILREGLVHATPSVIQQEMMLDTEEVTSERIKSKLQKYRKRKDESVTQFLEEYSDCIRSHQLSLYTSSPTAPPVGATAVAHLTQAIMQEELPSTRSQTKYSEQPSIISNPGSIDGIRMESFQDLIVDNDNGLLRLAIPQLSEQEKTSGIGRAFLHVLGIIEALSEQREQSNSSNNNKFILKGQREDGHAPEAATAADTKTASQRPLHSDYHYPMDQVQTAFVPPKTVHPEKEYSKAHGQGQKVYANHKNLPPPPVPMHQTTKTAYLPPTETTTATTTSTPIDWQGTTSSFGANCTVNYSIAHE